MADASVSSEGAMHYFYMAPFYASWLRTMRDVQRVVALEGDCKRGMPWGDDCNGTIADTTPHMPGLFGQRPADPSWGIAFAIVLENAFRYYGDRRLVVELYPSLAANVEWHMHLADTQSASGLYEWHYYGDWLQPGRVASDERISRMASAFNFLQAIRILARLARAIGYAEDAQKYETALGEKLDRFNAAFYSSSNGTYADGTQAALAFALYIGAPPSVRRTEQALTQLLARIAADGHLNTGILSTKWLMEVLSTHGRTDVALALALRTDFPSWGFMLANNATTVWEHWNAFQNPSGFNVRLPLRPPRRLLRLPPLHPPLRVT
jgi:alpha-L-rhamnosidase